VAQYQSVQVAHIAPVQVAQDGAVYPLRKKIIEN
jgi:hypothetical protein